MSGGGSLRGLSARALWGFALVANAFATGGCVAPRAEGGACVFNGDCAEPLLCSSGRCRAQCREDRDCPAGARCSSSTQPLKSVCVPVAEPRQCALASDCPRSARCEQGRCVAECREDRDCVAAGAGTACDLAQGQCVEPLRVEPADAEASPADASSDGPPSDGPCVAPMTRCGASCVDPSSDTDHCGACGTVCESGATCRAGRCVPQNDRCVTPVSFALTAGTVTVVSGTTVGATDGLPGCASEPDVYFSMELPEPGFVMLDTLGNGLRTRVGIHRDGCAGGAGMCSQQECAGRADAVTALLPAGRFIVSVETMAPSNFVFRAHFFATRAARSTRISNDPGALTEALAATPAHVGAGCGTGGVRLFFHVRCPTEVAPRLALDTCASPTIATRLALWTSDAMVNRCVRGGCATGAGALVDQALPGSVLGLTTVTVVGETASSTGDVTLTTRYSAGP